MIVSPLAEAAGTVPPDPGHADVSSDCSTNTRRRGAVVVKTVSISSDEADKEGGQR